MAFFQKIRTVYIHKAPMYSEDLCVRQDPLGGNWSDGLNARQLREVIREEKGSVLQNFSLLGCTCYAFSHLFFTPLKTQALAPCSTGPGLTDCISRCRDTAGSGQN